MNNSASMPRFRQINSHCCTVCLKIRFSTCHHHRNILKMGADRKHRLCQKHIRHIVETKQPPSWVGISRPTLAGVLMISSHHWSHHQPHHQHTTRLLMTIGPLDEPTAHWSPRQQQEMLFTHHRRRPRRGKGNKKTTAFTRSGACGTPGFQTTRKSGEKQTNKQNSNTSHYSTS